MVITYSHAKVQGQWRLVPKIEWKQTDGGTDGWVYRGDCIIPAALMRSVKKRIAYVSAVGQCVRMRCFC